MEGVVTSSKPVFSWEDPFHLDRQLNDEERMVRDSARQFARDVLLPRVIDDFREETFDRDVMRQMGSLGLLGPTIPDTYGGAGVNHVAYGLAAYEIEAVDSGYRSAMSVQSSLVMHPIHAFGTEEQKQKFLPKLASGEMIGCFGLTEPDYGSDPGGMVTKAIKVDGGYHLSGAKMWISNAPIADIAVVWAKLDGVIRGFVVERETAGDGFSTPKIGGKLSLRASVTGSGTASALRARRTARAGSTPASRGSANTSTDAASSTGPTTASRRSRSPITPWSGRAAAAPGGSAADRGRSPWRRAARRCCAGARP